MTKQHGTAYESGFKHTRHMQCQYVTNKKYDIQQFTLLSARSDVRYQQYNHKI